MSQSRKGRKISEKNKQILKTIRTGSVASEETREKIRVANTGSNSPVTKLNEQQVTNIKLQLMNGVKHKDLANLFEVPVSTIQGISKDQCWKHVIIDGWDEFIKSKKRKHKHT